MKEVRLVDFQDLSCSGKVPGIFACPKFYEQSGSPPENSIFGQRSTQSGCFAIPHNLLQPPPMGASP